MSIKLTLIISSAVFWLIALIFIIISAHRRKTPPMHGKSQTDLYGDVCAVSNLFCGFLLFELLCAGTALLSRVSFIAVVLFLPAYFLSLWAAHRLFPHIVNRIVGIFIKDR